jgi:hypothetical protein
VEGADVLALDSEAEASLTKDQRAFLAAAREWLGRGVLPEVETSASHEPRHDRSGFRYPGVLWVVLRPRGRHRQPQRPKYQHRSVQLGMSANGLVFGGWQGYPDVWEFQKNEAFRVSVEQLGLAQAEAAAFSWAERELRPP